MSNVHPYGNSRTDALVRADHWTRAQPPGGKGPEPAGLLPLAAAGERVAGPDEADNDQPENPEVTGIAAERDHAEDDDGDDSRDTQQAIRVRRKAASSSLSKSSASFWTSSATSRRASAKGSMSSLGLISALKQVSIYDQGDSSAWLKSVVIPPEVITARVVRPPNLSRNPS